jgi:hypothetical protein
MTSVPDHLAESDPAPNEPQLIRYCRRCHRKLRSEESMRRGFGPICFLKESEEAA